MIPNPQAKRILCYGDSNTWGQNPTVKGSRFATDQRWTGVLQAALGEEFAIIEEGLSSRTTDLDYSAKPGRNGRVYFKPCLESQKPLDMVVIMLGTNDLKREFGPRPVADITAALRGYIDDVRMLDAQVKIVLMSPVHIDTTARYFAEWYAANYSERAAEFSRTLGAELRSVAHDTDCYFFDAACVAAPGEDGIHIDAKGHHALGSALTNKIIEWCR